MEVERNLQDAMNVARNVMMEAKLTPGGGAVEMAVSRVSIWENGSVATLFLCYMDCFMLGR